MKDGDRVMIYDGYEGAPHDAKITHIGDDGTLYVESVHPVAFNDSRFTAWEIPPHLIEHVVTPVAEQQGELSMAESFEDFTRARLVAEGKKVATTLRWVADEVERRMADTKRVGSPGVESYAYVAGRTVDEVAFALGNMHLGSLTTAAYEADKARLEAAAEKGQK